MNNLNNSSHRTEKEMLKSINGETFLTNFIKSEELRLTTYNYEYCDIRAHIIEEYPIPISVGKNKLGGNNVKTRHIDFVYILCPGNYAIFRKECFSIGVEIKTSIRDMYRNPLQINNYFGKTDYMFLCVPSHMLEEAMNYVDSEDRLGLFDIETGEILKFPVKQDVGSEWKEKLLYRALFAEPILPMMQFKPRETNKDFLK